MSRSGYVDDFDENWTLIRWRGAVKSAIRGRRGQKLLRDMLAALDDLPEKELVADRLEASGAVCALGALGRARGMDMSYLDPDDSETVAAAFKIAPALAREIVWENDEGALYGETPRGRYERMRRWVVSQIKGDQR